MRDVLICGSGLGGLSAAIRLGAAGKKVLVIDQRHGPGGKAFTRKLGPYRFDTGPSLFTMAFVFQELFRSAGEDMLDYLELTPLRDELCHYFWDNYDSLILPGNIEGVIQNLGENNYASFSQTRDFFRRSKKLYERAGRLFLFENIHKSGFFLNPGIWLKLFSLLSIGALNTMNKDLRKYFTHHQALQIFQRYSTYNGSNPNKAPGTMNLIPFVEYGLGAWDVKGGIYAIPLALEKLARERGVDFRYNEKVLCFVQNKGRVIGARTEKNEYFASCTLSNIDVRTTYQLLGSPGTKWQKRYEKQENSSSGFVFYWGMGKRFPRLGLHNIFFSSNYDREFHQLFEERSFPEDPTVYVNITSKTNPRDAPSGKENWFVLVNTPGDEGQNWIEWRHKLRSKVTTKLSMIAHEDIESLIEVEDVLSPDLIASETGSFRGSLYGLASNTVQAAFNRHPSRVKEHPGLYFCGGGAHPGGGMPLVILSGKNASQEILKALNA